MATRTTKTDLSREQDNREAATREVDEFDIDMFEEFGPLPEIPARTGYVQRWVRVAVGNEADARNMATRARRGWKARQADTVDKSLQYMTVNREAFGNVIGTHDLILMERPKAIHDKVVKHEQQKVADQMTAVKRNLFREHKDIGGRNSGFEAPRDESTSRVVKGVATVMED